MLTKRGGLKESMDKGQLTYEEESALFSECLEAYRVTAVYGTGMSVMSVSGYPVSFIYPEGSLMEAMMRDIRMGADISANPAGFRIFVSDVGCRGFKMPASRMDRFRFTYRGDILGFEEGAFRASFYRDAGAVSTVSLEDNTAVILFRGKTALPGDMFLHVIVSTLSLMMENCGVYFLPRQMRGNGDASCLLTDRMPGTELFQKDMSDRWLINQAADWVSLKKEQLFMAQPFPGKGEPPETVTSFVCIGCNNDDVEAGNDVCPEITKEKLIFDTLSMLPFAGISHIRFIESLFRDMPLAFNYPANEKKTELPCSHNQNIYPYSPSAIKGCPKLSVIIPAYNASMFLPEAVDSVLSLNYPDYELIIVDDGSDDDTRGVVSGLSVECRYFYQDNMGPSAARNKGIHEATGDLILILDADDLLNPSGVKYLINLLLNDPTIDGAKGFAQKFRRSAGEGMLLLGSPAESFPFYIGSVVFRGEAFLKNGLFDEDLRLCEDTFWFSSEKAGELRIIQAEVVSLFVRRHEANITRSDDAHNYNLLKMLRKLT